MTNLEVEQELQHLKEQILLIDDNIKFKITVFLALLSIVLFIVGWALKVITRNWVEKNADEKFKQLENKYLREIDRLNENAISEIGENANGQYIRWGNGVQVCTKIVEVTDSRNVVGYPASFTDITNIQITMIGDKKIKPVVSNYNMTSMLITFDTDKLDGMETSIMIIGKWK